MSAPLALSRTRYASRDVVATCEQCGWQSANATCRRIAWEHARLVGHRIRVTSFHETLYEPQATR